MNFRNKLVCGGLDWKKLTNDKHSSLLRKSVIYGQKSFITLAIGVTFKPSLNLWVMTGT